MKTNNKNWTLIVGSHYSLSNDTDWNPMTDYSPGIWAVKTQKSIINFAKEILARGDSITVSDYNNPNYHTTANKIIKILGLNQPLFDEIKPRPVNVTNGKPTSLGALKKYLTVGKKIKIENLTNPSLTRDTEILQVKNDSIVTRKGEIGMSHLYFDKPVNWEFTNESATYGSIRDHGFSILYRIVYKD